MKNVRLDVFYFDNNSVISSGVEITTMPISVQVCNCLSNSNMFCSARYNTGIRFFDREISSNCLIGDGRWVPGANHVSVSAIQNSGSVCDAIARLSVMTMSPSVLYR